MSSCRLIVFERSGHWAAALRAPGLSGLPPVVETRSLAACSDALVQWPASLVALEATASSSDTVRTWIVEQLRVQQRAAMVALLAPEAANAELMFREAGAVDVIASVLDVPRIARLAKRCAARAPDSEPTFEQFVAEMLPWPGLATREWLADAT
jgi:hypothetical protein